MKTEVVESIVSGGAAKLSVAVGAVVASVGAVDSSLWKTLAGLAIALLPALVNAYLQRKAARRDEARKAELHALRVAKEKAGQSTETGLAGLDCKENQA